MISQKQTRRQTNLRHKRPIHLPISINSSILRLARDIKNKVVIASRTPPCQSYDQEIKETESKLCFSNFSVILLRHYRRKDAISINFVFLKPK